MSDETRGGVVPIRSESNRRWVPGDWVQATRRVHDEDHAAAEQGDLGSVLDTDGRWANVFFERTGMVCMCHPSELRFLGDANTGKFPTKTVTHGN